jgi:hypothetical protein
MIDSEERRNGISPAFSGTNAGMGLTKREMFAAMAMQGLCADSNFPDSPRLIEASVELADALLAELEKEKPKKCCDDVRNVVEYGGNKVTSVMLVNAIYGQPPRQRWQWQSDGLIWSPEFDSRNEALTYADANRLDPMPKGKTK